MTTKNKTILRSVGVLALFVLLAHSSMSLADEVTGNLSTGITATVGNSLTGTVSAPVTAPVSNGGGGGGGSSSGGGGSSRSNAPTTIVPTTPTPAPVGTGIVLGASTYNFTKELSIGSSDTDVTILQNMLIADGYLSLSTPTGYFGTLTKVAVTKFQAAHNIRATGYVGPLTLAALNVGTTPTIAQETASMSYVAGLEAQLATLETELAQMLATSSTASTTTK